MQNLFVIPVNPKVIVPQRSNIKAIKCGMTSKQAHVAVPSGVRNYDPEMPGAKGFEGEMEKMGFYNLQTPHVYDISSNKSYNDSRNEMKIQEPQE